MPAQKTPLHYYKANIEEAPVIIDAIETKEKIWQTHSNYFSILWIQQGTGVIETDFYKTKYQPSSVFCFNNYQAFVLYPDAATKGLLLLFHPNFFCIETYQHEVGCNGVLFNSVFNICPIALTPADGDELKQLLSNIEYETRDSGIATNELVFSYLKIFLVKLTRLKNIQSPQPGSGMNVPQTVEQLVSLINEYFEKEHSPSFYAERLHISIKALSNSCRKYFGKSISTLINEKLLLKAKWQLLHTRNLVKEIAAGLGFPDEYYFSRFFKKHTGLSPKLFREQEWEIRRGYLSIP